MVIVEYRKLAFSCLKKIQNDPVSQPKQGMIGL